MASQTVLASSPSSSVVDLKNVQGDLILGLQKRVEAFLFCTLKDEVKAKQDFRHRLKVDLLPLVTSTQDVLDAQRKIDESKRAHKPGTPKTWLPISQLNIGFSASGLRKLGLATDEIPGGAFGTGQRTDAVANLGDPIDPQTKALSSWSKDFLSHTIDLVILLTAPDQKLLDQKLQHVKDIVSNSLSSHFVRTGIVRPGSEAGHEHFGFLDGISSPKLDGVNSTPADKKAGIVPPSVILLGQPDAQSTNPLDAKQAWTKDGSFLAFRQLQQLVPEFQKFCDDSAKKNPSEEFTGELIGARIVGRWKSGTPITLAPLKDDPKLVGNQDFDYSDELRQERCPYAAHVRKTNPRNGLEGNDPKTAVLPHLMVRNGIPYGPEVTVEEKKNLKTSQNRGLLFVSYQSRLEDGFQFVQQLWSNNPNFPVKPPLKITPGFDLLIGQTNDQSPRTAQNIEPLGVSGDGDPNNTLTAVTQFVNPLGGEYFLMPSLSALKNKLGA